MYDYKAKEEDEIDLKKGQILTQMKPGDDQGKIGGVHTLDCVTWLLVGTR